MLNNSYVCVYACVCALVFYANNPMEGRSNQKPLSFNQLHTATHTPQALNQFDISSVAAHTQQIKKSSSR